MEATTKGAFELVVRAETEASRNDATEATDELGFWEAFRGAATVARDVIRVASTTMGDDDAPGGGRGRGRGRGARARGGAARGGAARGGGRRRGASTMPRDGDGDARGRGARAGGDGGGDADGGDARGMKIVVRALPRGLTREGFERALRRDGFEFGEAYAYLDYAQGKSRSGESGSGGASASGRVGDGGVAGAGRAAPLSRCYIKATSAETARAMMNKYNLAKFRVRERDSEGELVPNGAVEECVARAERAPSQWTPASYDEAKNGIRASSTTPTTTNDIETEDEGAKCVVVRNALENTIHEDEDYLKFVAALEDERRGGGKGATTNGPVAPASSDTRKKTTALLEFLWRKRAQEARHASTETANSVKSTKKKPKKKSKNASTSTAAADKTGPGPPNSGASKKQATSGKGGKNASKAKTPPAPKPEGSGTKIKAIRRPPPKPKQEMT